MDGTAIIRSSGSVRAETVAAGRNYRIKRLTLAPGEDLGADEHRHRTKQFVILCGRARITRGAATILVAEDASIFIPVGMPHRLQNPGPSALSLLEVQVGARFEEDEDREDA